MKEAKELEGYGIRAVERAARVLSALAEADGPRTITAIAEAAELSVPTTFRLLRTLQDQGLAMAHAEGGYTLGFRVLELAHALVRQIDIVAIARPFLNAVRSEVDETTGLVVRTGDAWVPVAYAEASQQVRRVMNLGQPTPLYADSAGKVLLAGTTDAEVEEYLARAQLAPFSETTVTDREVLRAQIREARTRGFAVSVNERGAGGTGVAAPIRAHDGRVVAALLIAAPASRFNAQLRASCVRAALAASHRISEALGFQVDRRDNGSGQKRVAGLSGTPS